MPLNLVDSSAVKIAPAPTPASAQAPPLTKDQSPTFSGFMRTPFPFGGSNPDGQRQFFQGTKFPTTRVLVPSASTNAGSGTVNETTNVLNIGTGGSSSGSAAQTKALIVSVTTPQLSVGQTWTGVLSMTGKSWQFLTLSTNDAARVELYQTQSAQQNDLGRSIYVAPAAGTTQGIISDVYMDTSPFLWEYTETLGANGNSPLNTLAYVTVTNFSNASATITASITYVPLSF